MSYLSSSSDRVLVIGTSTDYIDFINRRYPHRAIFVTDPAERSRGKEKAPASDCEILVAMEHPSTVLERIRAHLLLHGLQPSGVACFDCESMYLSSFIARELGLPYPTGEAVLASRSKFISKERWQRAGLDCPVGEQIEKTQEAIDFRRRHDGRVVIKPLTGSGSELVFICETDEACADALKTIHRRLAAMPKFRMYDSFDLPGYSFEARRVFLAEEFIEGEEYSCDFFIEGDKVEIVRIARKWLKPDLAPGIALAYQVPGELPASLDLEFFKETLRRAAQALGIQRALCMLDFLVNSRRLVLLELAPRPGGDCLPPLLLASCGLDILGLELDVAERRDWQVPPTHEWQPLVGLRLFAPRPGTIAALGAEPLAADPRVRQVILNQGPGHHVVHPPEDYHSRILGCVIFRPYAAETIEQECRGLHDKLVIHYEEE